MEKAGALEREHYIYTNMYLLNIGCIGHLEEFFRNTLLGCSSLLFQGSYIFPVIRLCSNCGLPIPFLAVKQFLASLDLALF